jgi:hypothetical protein
MLKTQDIQVRQHKDAATGISHFSLQGLLSIDHTLVLNPETRTLSLLSDGPTLIVEQQLSTNEMCVFVPILESFPHYCPYEVLLSHICTRTVTQASIERCRQRLREAHESGKVQQELRPIRRALSSLRNKLYRLDLGISNVRERGCSLIGLSAQSPEHRQL